MSRLSDLFRKTSPATSLAAPVDGQLIELSSVADPAFSTGLLGPGAAFTFDGDVVCAPCDGLLTALAATTHAFGVTADTGVEVLVHVGLDTVEREGRGFTALATQGERVHAGQPIIRLDREDFVGVDLTTPMVVTMIPDGQTVSIQPSGAVRVGGAALRVAPPTSSASA